jgi:hypothetical protein
MSRPIFIIVIFFSLLFAACKKTDNSALEPVSDYFPLTIGKYITYDVDSTVPIYQTTALVLDSFHYQIQYIVDGVVYDNLNRLGYHITCNFRLDSSYLWVPYHTAMAVNTGSTIEFSQDNQKYIKLVEPIQQDFSWNGNAYLYTDNTDSLQYLQNWNYTYDSLNFPITLNSLTIDSTIKVAETNQQVGVQDHTDLIDGYDTLYSTNTYSVEKYAKGIGLVYRDFFYNIYQPADRSQPFGAFGYTGYGLTLKMIDHN